MNWAAITLTVALAASPKVSVEYRGTLRDALKVIAQKGEINLIVIGELTQPAEVMLKEVSAEDALTTVAEAYQLELKRDGKIWMLREQSARSASDTLRTQAEAVKQQAQALAEKATEEFKNKAERMKDAASGTKAQLDEEAQKRAEEMKEHAEELKEAAWERAEEVKEAAMERAAALKEHAEEMAEHTAGGANAQRASFGGPIVVKAGERVESAVAFGGNVTIEEGATVEDDAVAFGGDVVLEKNSRVEGDAVSWGGQVRRADSAKVGGQIVSMGEGAIGNKLANSAFKMSGPAVNPKNVAAEAGATFAGFLLQFALTFGLGFLFLMLTPQRIKTMEADITRGPAQVGLAGLLGALLLIPITIGLVVTLIGIPVALVMWLLLPIVLAMGFTAVANVVGMHLPFGRARRTQALVLALGILVVQALSYIPVVGTLVGLTAAIVSFGTLIRTRLGSRGQGQPVQDLGMFSQEPTQPVA
ncbi:MAG: hypothetical protein K1X64_08470 [Myxococcaceae bacterium]|nr:hypothetical protein [Myxococcaceae bacterium]